MGRESVQSRSGGGGGGVRERVLERRDRAREPLEREFTFSN